VLPVFCGKFVITLEPLDVTVEALIVPEMLLVQLRELPPTVAVGVKLKPAPLQSDVEAGKLATCGTGCTVTVTFIAVPLQPLAVGVTE
jgi:hypothetical protein